MKLSWVLLFLKKKKFSEVTKSDNHDVLIICIVFNLGWTYTMKEVIYSWSKCSRLMKCILLNLKSIIYIYFNACTSKYVTGKETTKYWKVYCLGTNFFQALFKYCIYPKCNRGWNNIYLIKEEAWLAWLSVRNYRLNI